MSATQWVSEIEELYLGQKRGRIKPKEANAMNATLGRLIGFGRMQLQHMKLQPPQKNKTQVLPMLEMGAGK